MRISIIVPVYNAYEYLERCINSILKQTYKNIELILIDDGSTDISGEICDEYAQKDERVVVFHLSNNGAASARNYAIKKASGDYLFFVDSDDFILENTIEEMLAIGEGKDIIYCDYYKYFDDEKKEYIKLIPFETNNPHTHILSMPGPVCKLIKRDIFIENNLFFLEGKYYEDLAIMPAVCSLAKDMAYLKKAKYYYYQRIGSMMNQMKYSEKLVDIFDSLNHLMLFFKNNNTLNDYYDEVEYIYIDHLLHAASLRFLPFIEGEKYLVKIYDIIKNNFPNWRKNKYYKKMAIKYKIVCTLLYLKKYKFLRRILKTKREIL